MIMLQAIMPVLLAQSAARGSAALQTTLRGGTNHPQGDRTSADFTALCFLPTLVCRGIETPLLRTKAADARTGLYVCPVCPEGCTMALRV